MIESGLAGSSMMAINLKNRGFLKLLDSAPADLIGMGAGAAGATARGGR
ncbi:MAG: hypothetical protein AAGE01_22580 [Pseudomonadota bacterium]